MTRTTKERAAIQKDIEQGLSSICNIIGGIVQNLPTAINELHPASTGTRKIVKAYGHLVDALADFRSAAKLGITLKKE